MKLTFVPIQKGFHLEGPFISMDKKVAHNRHYVCTQISPSSVLSCYHSLQVVRIITLAPELPGAMETIQWLRKEYDVIVGFGHTSAHLHVGLAEEGIKSGAKR